MRKLLPAFLAVLLLALSAAPLPAQDEENTAEDTTNLDSLEAALNAAHPVTASRPETTPMAGLAGWEQWWQKSLQFQRQDSVEQSLACADSAVAKARLQDLHLPVLSSYWVYRSGRALQADDLVLARRYASLALAVNSASIPAIMAGFSATSGMQGFRRALGELSDQLGPAAQDFGVQLRYGSQVLVWACLVLLTWGLIFSLYLSVKYLPRLSHLVAELLPRFLPAFSRMTLVAAAMLGLAAALAWISLALSILLLAIACAALATTKEKVLLFISFSLVLIAAAGLSLGHHLFSRIDDDYLDALNRANHAPYSAGLNSKLAGYQQRDSSDLLPPFAMALLEKRAGNPDRARAILFALSSSVPNAGAVNNLGNLYFIRKSYDTAAVCYRQAIEWDPALAIAHYNLAQADLARLDFNAAQGEQEKAVRLNLAEIESRAARYGSGVPMDQLISGRLLWTRVMQGWNPLAGFGLREITTLTGLPLWLPPPAVLGLLIALILWTILMGNKMAQEDCATCGAMICKKCHTATLAGEKLCRGCTEKIGMAASPDLQRQLAAKLAVRRHYRIILRSGLANLFLPGSALAIGGSTVGAWLLALGWSAVAVALIANGAGLPSGQLAAALAGNRALGWVLSAGGLLLAISWLGYLSYLGRHAEPEPALPKTASAPDEGPSEKDDHAA